MVSELFEVVLFLAIVIQSVAASRISNHEMLENGNNEVIALLTNKTRLGRIFKFNKENSEIRVELDFAIPFLSIPVNTKPKIGDSGKNYLVDVNLGALTAASLFSVVALIFIPKLFKGFRPLAVYDSAEKREKRSLMTILSRVDKALLDHNIDSTICSQKAVCWLVNTAVDRVTKGSGGGVDKILDGVTSVHWFEEMLRGTAIQVAVDNGRSGRNCSELYSRCTLTQEVLVSTARYFTGGIR